MADSVSTAPLWGSEDPHCPIRRMLAEELIKQRAESWQLATTQDQEWALSEAFKMQKEHERMSKDWFEEKA